MLGNGQKDGSLRAVEYESATQHAPRGEARVGLPRGPGGDGTVDMTIAITTDTLTGTDAATGSRTLGPSHAAVIQKMTATTWKYAASDL